MPLPSQQLNAKEYLRNTGPNTFVILEFWMIGCHGDGSQFFNILKMVVVVTIVEMPSSTTLSCSKRTVHLAYSSGTSLQVVSLPMLQMPRRT